MTREISDETVQKATGRRWKTWTHILSESDVAEKSRKQIAAWLREDMRTRWQKALMELFKDLECILVQ